MKSILSERRKSSILGAVACIVIGAVLVAFPQDAVRWVCMVFGAILTVAGLWNLISFFRARTALSVFQLDLFIGLVLLVLGAWLLLMPDSVVALLQYVFGAFILLHGLIELQAAITLRGGFLPILLAILPVAVGVLIILDPFGSLAVLVVLIGIALIYNGLIDLYLILRLSRAAKALAAAAEEAEAEEAVLSDAQFEEADPTAADWPEDR